jgi:hypothetical protein
MSERPAAMIRSVGHPHSLSARAVIAWGIAALSMSAAVFSLSVWTATPLDFVVFLTMPLAFGGVGAFLTVRVPGNPIGPILLTAAAGFATLIASGGYIVAFVDLPSADPAAVLAGLLVNLTFVPTVVVVIVGVPLLFPDGHFLSPRWRAVAVVAAIVVVTAELGILFGRQNLVEEDGLLNPFYAEALLPVVDASSAIAAIAAAPLFALAIASLVLRYRRADDIGRHQIRWLAAIATVAVIAFACSTLAPDLEPLLGVAILALNAIPVAIGIAIVRYRLYDIDRLISRGISYGLVTVVLLATYVAIVLVLQSPLGAVFGTQTVTVAISTLIVASLFQPVRRRIQRSVDRRFDRARVDTDRTAAAFSERLRAEVDIDAVIGDLAATASGAVRPSDVRVWLREPVPPS